MNNLERRTLPAELRADGDKIVGYAAVYNSDSQDLGGFVERIAPGAFDQSIATAADSHRAIKALVNHDEGKILGHTENGRLNLSPDEKGLGVEIDPSDTSYARDLIVNLADDNASKMSFGFVVRHEDWDESDGQTIRLLKEVELYEVSVLQGYEPAYRDTTVALRMFEEYKSARAYSEELEPEEQEEEVKGFSDFDLMQRQIELEAI